MSRWTFVEVDTGLAYEMPINPDSMSSPHQDRQLTTSYGARTLTGRLRTFEHPTPAKDWEFAGVIRTQEMYDALVTWSKVPGKVHVTDHLGRTFEVLFDSFEATDRRPTGTNKWRMRYSMKALLLRRVS